MASNRGNKPKKEGMYVYNMVPNVAPVKNVISKGWGYSLLMRSKTYKESSNREKVVGEIVSNEPRKSASSIVGEMRSSVSDQGEANVRSAAAFLQVKVLVSDMPGFMQVHAFRCARTAYDSLDKFSSKHMAFNIKKEFDKVYGPAWHCIVGSSFGSFVTHSTRCFLYFSMEKLYILVFRTKVQRALQDHI